MDRGVLRQRVLAALAFAWGLGLAVAASADTRGISVQLRASDDANAPVTETVKLYGSSHALVIGIDRYTGGWPRLSNAVNDARAVAEELDRQGFQVTLKTDLTATRLDRALKEFFAIKGNDPNARLLLWFAGHGHTDRGEGYLVPADAPPASSPRFLVTAIPMRGFGTLVRYARSKHVLAVFDSCFSGTVFTARAGALPAAITKKTTRPVRQFLTSGDAGQQVRDDGSFRKLFIRALRGEERADANRDGYLTGEELGLFMSQEMATLTEAAQTPKHGKLHDVDFNQGDFVFVLPGGAKPYVAAGTSSIPGDKAMELAFWNSIQGSTNPAMFEEYLRKYPDGQFAGLARLKIEELKTSQVASLPPVHPAVGVYPMRPGKTFKDCDVCPEMVVIPAGSFRMGDLSGDGFRDEMPVHMVTIPRPFAVGKYEVTQAEWKAVMGSNPSRFRGSRNPVDRVSWKEAKEYVYRLSQKTGKQYRLLSESEWEYMARAGSSTKYPWGNSISSSQAKYGNRDGTVPVGSYRPNAFGVYDTVGNVWEWVEDCWHDTYNEAPTDGSAWTGSGECGRLILRGGPTIFEPWVVRSAGRFSDGSGHRGDYFGFRVARTF